MKLIYIILIFMIMLQSCAWLEKEKNKEMLIRIGVALAEIIANHDLLRLPISSDSRMPHEAYLNRDTGNIIIVENGRVSSIIRGLR